MNPLRLSLRIYRQRLLTLPLPSSTMLPRDLKLIQPTRGMQWLNFALFQFAWFAGVVAAAHRLPLIGAAMVAAAIAWHVAAAARPLAEAKLIGCALVIGFVFESFDTYLGELRFAAGVNWPRLPPPWIVLMWGLLATALNVTMRWLKRRWLLAALLGAIAGPMSYAAGVRLGGVTFINANAAVFTLAIAWACLMPMLVWLSDRYDGVAVYG